jgi:hypothetical protein
LTDNLLSTSVALSLDLLKFSEEITSLIMLELVALFSPLLRLAKLFTPLIISSVVFAFAISFIKLRLVASSNFDIVSLNSLNSGLISGIIVLSVE